MIRLPSIDNSIFKKSSPFAFFIACIVSVLEAYVLMKHLYIGIIPCAVFLIAISLLLLYANLRFILVRSKAKISSGIIIYSALLSLTLIVGNHICVSDTYSGTVDVNYLTRFGVLDILSFAVLTVSLIPLFSSVLDFSCKKTVSLDITKPLNVRQFIISGLFLSVFWLIYLFVYWPGILTSDAIISVSQIIGQSRIDNRNPILYTLAIKFLFHLTNTFDTKDVTLALGLLDVIQVVYFAFSVSYMITWICSKSTISKIWKYILPIFYILSSFVGIQTITMLKDPIFNASIINLSVFLLEYSLSKADQPRSLRWHIHIIAFIILVLFWRNNGISAIIAVLLGLIIHIIMSSKKQKCFIQNRTIIVIISTISIIYLVIVGPVFSRLQIGTPREESVGIMLQQMASVAAKDGNMTENEKEFLNSILPIDEYHDAYKPCCVDLLKWNNHMNYGSLYGLDFYKTWISLMIKNPFLYFESWVLETFGFWTVNTESINSISSFYEADLSTEKTTSIYDYSINIHNLFGGDELRSIFTSKSWALPIGILNWSLLFIIICLKKKGLTLSILSALPVLGIAVGLIIGTPIFYLARYEASIEYLIPLFSILFLM